ncbi:MAG: chorismate-binding protein [Steroidobacteraceae bacterium]|jgi:anthranilate synthase component 1|nr:chorismate-binding protein [Steroidobacteraceae bacterium]
MGGRARPLRFRELSLPAEALLRLAESDPATHPVLFDSASRGPLARHSVLVSAAGGDALWLGRDGRLGARGAAARHASGAAGFLDALERWWRDEAATAGFEAGAAGPRPEAGSDESAQPWRGGFAVFAGYELAAEVEPTLRLPATPLPYVAFAVRTRAALVADLERGRVRAVAEDDGSGEARLRQLEEAARAALGAGTTRTAVPAAPPPIVEDDPAEFLGRVLQVQELIRAGELYQANLSRGWQALLPEGAWAGALYRGLRAANPAPFAVRCEWDGVAILSSSPERLMRIESGRISTRPIAGTRPRRAGDAADREARIELVAHPKERAEHVMLIDLERNDLGRVCVAGSVRVEDFMSIESYAHVHHIVSGVAGTLRAGVTPVGALRAVFPGGTITGCPKVRCMRAIGELERAGRGAYTGSIGMLGLDGSADFNILIRTLVVAGGVASLRAGAGIVADSIPERELEETRAKARGVLAALESLR